ncbi:MAG: translation initiation factor IF-2, partial [Bacteroidales bacterium]|nr:translation initiation factor IF-2 [Bacteroidales bacterium]
MSVRLNKVVRDLNVGIDTVVGFLQKKGIEIDSNPNAKISDEQYQMLVKEFAPDKTLKKESDTISLERQKRPTPVEKTVEPTPVATPEAAKPRVLRTIDLDKKPSTTKPAEQPKKEEPKATPVVEAKPEPAPRVEKPQVAPQPEVKKEPVAEVKETPVVKKEEPKATPAVEAKPEPQKEEPKATPVVEKKEEAPAADANKNEVFTLGSVSTAPKPQVLGRIDLDSINQQTRPKKKSKE